MNWRPFPDTLYMVTIYMITKMADRIITVKSGKVQNTEINEHPIPVEEISW